ncbi:MAG: hypothetical protein KC502_04455 [Myxococcales bacterium]|nr:hypothetical protein [Myxococcales bacterium]
MNTCARRLVLIALIVACVGCEDSAPIERHPLDDVLRINQLQFKGTHNSYHIAPGHGPIDWRYTHAPLDTQLGQQGVRQFELDVYTDEDGGPFIVQHVPTLDEETTCNLLTDCLRLIAVWSTAHPDHVPIWVWIEPKNTAEQLVAWKALERLDKTIVTSLPDDRRITPDQVRGAHTNLQDAIAADGWPTLAVGRGKVVVVLLDSGGVRDAYVANNPALKGRAMFAEGKADSPWGVIAKIDGPKGDGKTKIQEAVAARRIIRTRADSTKEPWAGDTSRRQAAFDSGAQMVSTDFPAPVKAPAGYWVEVPGGDPVRCNPVTAPAVCDDRWLAGTLGNSKR